MRVRIIVERRGTGRGPSSPGQAGQQPAGPVSAPGPTSGSAGMGLANSALVETLSQLGYQVSLDDRLPASGVDPAEVLLIDARRLRKEMLGALAALAATRRLPKIIALTRKEERTFRMDTLMRAGVSTIVPWDPTNKEPKDGSLKSLLEFALREVTREERKPKPEEGSADPGTASERTPGASRPGRTDAAGPANPTPRRRVRRIVWWRPPFADPRRRPGNEGDAGGGPNRGAPPTG